MSLFCRNLELIAERFRKRFLDTTNSNKVEKFRPEWLACDQLMQRIRFTEQKEMRVIPPDVLPKLQIGRT